jgi:ParB-like chromosome segregation protein Spo0J
MMRQLEIRKPEDLAPDHASASFGDQPAAIEAPADRHREEHTTGLVVDVPQQRVKSFALNRIHVGRRVRSLNSERVAALMESIQLIGLRSPITVRIIPQVAGDRAADGGVPILVAGLHRLEAVKRLGLEEIDCLIEPGSELDAQLWEIDENLCRAELTELERAEHLRQRKAIYEELHPQSRHGGLPGGGKAKTANLAGFAVDTAIKTGIAERTIRRDIRRANKIDETVRDRIRDKRDIADNGAELDTLASMPVDEQMRVIDTIEAGQATSVRQAKKRLPEAAHANEPALNAPAPVEIRPVAGRSAGQRSPPQSLEEAGFAWEAGARRLIPLLVDAVVKLEEIPEEQKICDLLRYCRFGDLAEQLSKRLRRSGEGEGVAIENAAKEAANIGQLLSRSN